LCHLDTALSLSKAGSNAEDEVKAQGRALISSILKSYAVKFKQISLVLPHLIEEAKALSGPQKPSGAIKDNADKASLKSSSSSSPLSFLQLPLEKEPKDMHECRHLVSQMLGSAAQPVNCIIRASVNACSSFGKNCVAPHGGMGAVHPLPLGVTGVTDEDIKELGSIFVHGLGCLKLFHSSLSASGGGGGDSGAMTMKEAAEMVCFTFTCHANGSYPPF
jgi:hypothetical protein